MSKILCIPDIHGNFKNALKNIYDHKDEVDYVVTLGDYVDDFDESLNGKVMIDGFNELCNLARNEPNKFRIVLGNHDCAYLSETRQGNNVSGHHWDYHDDYHKMFIDNLDLLHPLVIIDDVFFSHGGLNLNWYEFIVGDFNRKARLNTIPLDLLKKQKEMEYKLRHINEEHFDGMVFSIVDGSERAQKYLEIEGQLKEQQRVLFEEYEKLSSDIITDDMKEDYVKVLDLILNTKTYKFDYTQYESGADFFNHCGWDAYGDSVGESITWIRPISLMKSEWPKCKCQIVGHSECGYEVMEKDDKKLFILDSPDHDKYYIFDTDNL